MQTPPHEDSATASATASTTTVRLLSSPDELTVLAENRMESDDATEKITIGRPRVVHSLLEEAESVAGA